MLNPKFIPAKAAIGLVCLATVALTGCGSNPAGADDNTKPSASKTAAVKKTDPVVARCVASWNQEAGEGANARAFYAQSYTAGARNAYVNEGATRACVVALPLSPDSANAGASAWAETPDGWLQLISGGAASNAVSSNTTGEDGSSATERFMATLPYARELEANAAQEAVAELNADGTLTAIAGASPSAAPDMP